MDHYERIARQSVFYVYSRDVSESWERVLTNSAGDAAALHVRRFAAKSGNYDIATGRTAITVKVLGESEGVQLVEAIAQQARLYLKGQSAQSGSDQDKKLYAEWYEALYLSVELENKAELYQIRAKMEIEFIATKVQPETEV